MDEQEVAPSPIPAMVAVVGANADLAGRLAVTARLREAGLRVRPDGSTRKLGRQLESAAKAGARWAVIVGDEIAHGEVVLRDLVGGEQRQVALDRLAATIAAS